MHSVYVYAGIFISLHARSGGLVVERLPRMRKVRLRISVATDLSRVFKKTYCFRCDVSEL